MEQTTTLFHGDSPSTIRRGCKYSYYHAGQRDHLIQSIRKFDHRRLFSPATTADHDLGRLSILRSLTIARLYDQGGFVWMVVSSPTVVMAVDTVMVVAGPERYMQHQLNSSKETDQIVTLLTCSCLFLVLIFIYELACLFLFSYESMFRLEVQVRLIHHSSLTNLNGKKLEKNRTREENYTKLGVSCNHLLNQEPHGFSSTSGKSCWKNLYHGLKQENQPVMNPLPANCSFKNMIDEVREKENKNWSKKHTWEIDHVSYVHQAFEAASF
ncbi:hypothetical protein ISN45_Aa06g034360 [Arabidopsis thaliana x Arabidopsis arenosa]|uniref:Uncharacterized protein n=1 Tax=Arabidopsis thaliana x Arabidopsis arenosa TaxID=1240361 RepID=A0A8T1Z2F1_9BRAS|nr:hypothetical protein ISN45_Aa06g034360 [Arabidopsis thaliana x Arabidopsis arenosa]